MRLINCLLLLGLTLCFSCGNDPKSGPDLKGIEAEASVIRFEEEFYRSSPERLASLKEEFPYLFPMNTPDSVWVNKMQDEDEQYLFAETQKIFGDFTGRQDELVSLFRHMKYYFPGFDEPTVITMISEVDYDHKIIYADSLLLVSLDMYLGPEHEVYQDFPTYVKQNYDADHLIVDVAESFSRPVLRRASGNSYVELMVQEGKRLMLMSMLLPDLEERFVVGYDQEQWDWAVANEQDIWKYFVQNELIYSTDSELSKRFLEPAPFSKFYLEVDKESPGRIGAWFGLQIVKAFMEQTDAGVGDLISTDNEELFRQSRYKPSK